LELRVLPICTETPLTATLHHAPGGNAADQPHRLLSAGGDPAIRGGDPTLSPEVRGFLTIGFCGGYTTFSTFSCETAALLEDGEWARAGMYVALSVVLSLVGTFLGFALAREAIALRERL
jgi:hypothetical protein